MRSKNRNQSRSNLPSLPSAHASHTISRPNSYFATKTQTAHPNHRLPIPENPRPTHPNSPQIPQKAHPMGQKISIPRYGTPSPFQRRILMYRPFLAGNPPLAFRFSISAFKLLKGIHSGRQTRARVVHSIEPRSSFAGTTILRFNRSPRMKSLILELGSRERDL
jgi:hypothetical protein